MFLFQMKINKTHQGSQPLISAGHKQIFTFYKTWIEAISWLSTNDFWLFPSYRLSVYFCFIP